MQPVVIVAVALVAVPLLTAMTRSRTRRRYLAARYPDSGSPHYLVDGEGSPHQSHFDGESDGHGHNGHEGDSDFGGSDSSSSDSGGSDGGGGGDGGGGD